VPANSLDRLPLGAAAVLAPFHQRRKRRRRIAAELAGVQRLSDAQDPRVARRRRHPVSVRALRASSLRGKGRASPTRCGSSTTTRSSIRRTRSNCSSRRSASTGVSSVPSRRASARVKDRRPDAGFDETRFTIESIDWLTAADKETDLRGQRKESVQPEGHGTGRGLGRTGGKGRTDRTGRTRK